MMGSLMADLEKNVASLNKWLTKRDKPNTTEDELLLKLFNEVKHIWPMLGYPPLVTPFSQYVKNAALMNVIQMTKGKERWSMLDENTWGMILGKSGNLPGELAPEILQMAKDQKREFFNGNPQDLYPDKETSEKGIKVGDMIQKGETVAYVEAMKVINAITADESGKVAEILVNHGDEIEEDDQLIRIV